MDLSIILPAYNEELVIESTIEKIIEYLKNRYFSYELIVVNDGSVDQTGKIVKSLNLPVLRLIEHEKNLGKGAAVKSGMLMAKGENLLFLDADYSTTIDNLAIFLSILKENQADIVIASRALKNSQINIHQCKIKENIGKIGNKLIKQFLLKGIEDTQCGFKLFNRRCLELFKKQKINGWGFDFEILYLAQKLGYKICQAPVVWSCQPDSKVTVLSYFKTLGELFLIKYNILFKKY